VLFKVIRRFLAEPFQYFGVEVFLAAVLQFFVASRLFRLLLPRNFVGTLLCRLFFVISPILTNRIREHFSLTNQWLLLAALLIFLKAHFKPQMLFRRLLLGAAR
jgi:hypothetical protein